MTPAWCSLTTQRSGHCTRTASRVGTSARSWSAQAPRVRFHDLRHTTASRLLQVGVSPKVVPAIMEHPEIKVTMDLYSHIMPGMLNDASVRLQDSLVPAPKSAPELHLSEQDSADSAQEARPG